MIRQATLPLLFVLSPSLQPAAGEILERRLRRAVRRREPIALGTAAVPYEPAGRPDESPLRRVLLREEGLEIAITTGTARILRELELLVELDRRHSVAVRMVMPASKAEDPEPRLRAVGCLAAEGIATRVLVSPAGAETLRYVFEQAVDAGAQDVEMDTRSLRRGERNSRLATFRRLRLEYGFPRAAVGRG